MEYSSVHNVGWAAEIVDDWNAVTSPQTAAMQPHSSALHSRDCASGLLESTVFCKYISLLLLGRVTLSVERKRPIVIEHSLQPSVGLCVCLSVQCIVAKRLIGYGCGLGW